MNFATVTLLFSFLLSGVVATPGGQGSKTGNTSSESRPLLMKDEESTSDHSDSANVKSGINFDHCSPNQITKLKKAAAASNVMITKAHSQLTKFKPNKRKKNSSYTTWFGEYDNTRYQDVLSRFGQMKNKATSITYDCEACANRVPQLPHAYISRSEENFKINICPGFWKLQRDVSKLKSNFRSPSQAGIIVQELSRVYHTAGEYHLPDRSKAKSLASNNPTVAVKNAVNYMYFAHTTFRSSPRRKLSGGIFAVSRLKIGKKAPGHTTEQLVKELERLEADSP